MNEIEAHNMAVDLIDLVEGTLKAFKTHGHAKIAYNTSLSLFGAFYAQLEEETKLKTIDTLNALIFDIKATKFEDLEDFKDYALEKALEAYDDRGRDD